MTRGADYYSGLDKRTHPCELSTGVRVAFQLEQLQAIELNY